MLGIRRDKGLFKKVRIGFINVSTATVVVASSLGGALPLLFSSNASALLSAPSTLDWLSPSMACGSVSTVKNVKADWSKVTGAASYNLLTWTTATGAADNSEATAVVTTGITGTKQDVSFNQGDGQYFFEVQAVDSSNNASTPSVACSAYFDQTAPSAPTLNFPADNVYRQTSNSNYSAWDAVTDPSGPVTYNYESSFDPSFATLAYGPASTGTSTSIANPGEPAGTYYWRVQACDAANNCSDWSNYRTINIDNTAPSVPSINSPHDGDILKPSAVTEVDWTASTDNFPLPNQIDYIYQASNSGDTNPDGSFVSPVYTSSLLTTNSIPTPATPAGTYYIHVSAVDQAGNQSAWSTAVKVIIDDTAPTVTVTPTGSLISGHQTFHITASDDHPGVWTNVPVMLKNTAGTMKFTGQSVDLSSGSADVTLNTKQLDDGDATFELGQIADAAGNTTGPTDFTNYTIDNTAPGVTVTGLITNDQTPTLTGTVTDPDAAVKVKVDGHSYDAHNNGGGTWTVDVTHHLDEGIYNVEVKATDLAGNTGKDTTTNELTIDTTKPTVSFVTPQNKDAVHHFTKVEFDVYDQDIASYTLSVDGNQKTSGTTNGSPHTYWLNTWSLGNGWHTLTLTASDLAGNSKTISEKILVDNTAPNLTIDNPNQYDYLKGSVKINGTASDNGSGLSDTVYIRVVKAYGYYCSFYTQQYLFATIQSHGHWNTTLDTTSLNDGNYCVIASTRDNVGNWTQQRVDYVTVDNESPKAGFTNPTPADGDTVNSDFTVGFWLHDNIALQKVHVTLRNASGKKVVLCYKNTLLNGHHFWTTCTVTLPNQTILPDGAYTLKISVKDKAGNKTVVTRTINIDRTGPVVTVNNQTTTSTKPIITGAVDDPTATVSLSIDGGAAVTAVNSGTGTWSYAVTNALSVGTHTVQVTAVDNIGNISNVANGTVTVQSLSTGGSGGGSSSNVVSFVTTSSSNGGNSSDSDTGDVLGAQTDNGTGQTSSTSTDNGNNSDKTGHKSKKFLGLGWWWLLVLAAILAGLWWFLAGRRRKDED